MLEFRNCFAKKNVMGSKENFEEKSGDSALLTDDSELVSGVEDEQVAVTSTIQDDSLFAKDEKLADNKKFNLKSAMGWLAFIFLGAFLAVSLSDKVTDVIAKDSIDAEHYLVTHVHK